MTPRVLHLFLLILFTQIANSQSLPFKHYTSPNGLSQNQVTCLVEDRQGYIWVGTKGGLNRFDGIEFEKFGKYEGLLSSNIKQLILDDDGKIWAITGRGLSVFKGQSFDSYPVPLSDGIIEIARYGNNEFYLTVEQSLHTQKRSIWQFKNGQYQRIKHSNTLPADSLVLAAYSKKYGVIFFKNRPSRYLFAYKDGKLDTLVSNFKSIIVRAFCDNDGEVLIQTGESISQTNHQTLKELHPLTRKDLLGEALTKDNRLILCYTFDSLLIISNKQSKTIKWPYDQLVAAIEDSEGNLWVGTEYGLYRQTGKAFENFTEYDGINKNVWSIVEDKKQNIWLASFGYGLQRYNGKTIENVDVGKTPNFNHLHYYMGSTCLDDGRLCFTTHSGIITYNGTQFTVNTFSPHVSTALYAFQNPYNQHLLISTTTGVYIYDKNNKLINHLTDIQGLNANVLGITVDKNGIYWFAGRRLVKFDGQHLETVDPNHTPFEATCCIEADSTGNIWIGANDGLFVYRNGQYMSCLPTEQNSGVNFICQMNQDSLLIGRNSDLVIFDKNAFLTHQPHYYKVMGESEGFQGIDCGQNGCLKDSKGRYWIASANMVSRFNPQLLKVNANPPRLYLKRLEVMNDSLVWQTHTSLCTTANEVSLDYHQTSIRLKYSAISPSNPERVRYRYRLKGYQDLWSPLTTERIATFTNLKPGNYTFEVEAVNADGVYSSNTTSCNISIHPAFWQILWVKLLGVLLFAAVVSGIVLYWYKRRQQAKNEQEKLALEYSKLQMATILNQFDPHFTFNVISSVGAYILTGDPEKAYRYLTKLASLLRMALGGSESLVKTVAKELEFIDNYCDIQQLRFGDRFRHVIEISPQANLDCKVPKMLIQTFVENAIKHGIEPKANGGCVTISVLQDDAAVKIIVSDDGIGRAAAAKHNTYGTRSGTRITGQLLELMNQRNSQPITIITTDLYDDQQQAAGTSVSIVIPYNYRFI
jgi:ligand-binding sensor domain-containing protein